MSQVVQWEVTMSHSTFTIRLLGAAAILPLVSACGSSTVTPGSGASAVKAALPGGVLGVVTTALGPVMRRIVGV